MSYCLSDSAAADAASNVKSVPEIRPELMPMGIREALEGVIADNYLPAVVMLYPMIGTLATNLQFDEHGVPTCINGTAIGVGESGSGKSFITDIYKTFMHRLIEETRKTIDAENEYNRMPAKMREKLEEPVGVCRILSARTSLTEATRRMVNAKDMHLFTFCAESDMMAQNRSKNSFNLSVMSRVAYENGTYSSDYRSSSSFNSYLDHVKWNMVLTGTPDAIHRLYRNVVDGELNRAAFIIMNDNTFARLVIPPKRSAQQIARMKLTADLLECLKGNVTLERLELASQTWLEKVRLETMKNDDSVRAGMRIRTATTSMRIVASIMLCSLCEKVCKAVEDREEWIGECKTAKEYLLANPDTAEKMLPEMQTDYMMQLYEYFADTLLDNAMLLFGERIRAEKLSALNTVGTTGRVAVNNTLYALLNNEFTVAEAAMVKKDESAGLNATRQMIKRWKKAAFIEQVSEGTYRKLVMS